MDDELQLILPERPDSEDLTNCGFQIDDIQFIFEVEPGPGQLTYKNLQPFVKNLVTVSTQLVKRARLAKSRFLDKDVKAEFDYVQLQSTVEQIERMHKKVLAYYRLTEEAKTLPSVERLDFLFDFIYYPLFHGSGFEIPEDEESPWVKGLSMWCEPIRLGIALENAIGFHIPTWNVVKKIKGGESYNLGYVLIGGATIFGGVKLFQWWYRQRR